MLLPGSINFPWKPDQVTIRAKSGYVINQEQVEYIKQLIKALSQMYNDISNIINYNANMGNTWYYQKGNIICNNNEVVCHNNEVVYI